MNVGRLLLKVCFPSQSSKFCVPNTFAELDSEKISTACSKFHERVPLACIVAYLTFTSFDRKY